MRILLNYILLLVIFLVGCKNNEPTAPEEAIPSEAVAEATVGPEGGTLETNEFKLTIPGGAFETVAELKLYAESGENPFGEFSVSPSYRVAGIPNGINTVLQVSLKYSGTLSGVNYIVVGKEDSIKLYDTSYVGIKYNLVEAVEEGDFLTGDIALNNNSANFLNKTNLTEAEIILNALTNGTNRTATENFRIKGVIPAGQEEQVDKVVDIFKEVYKRFKDAGFDYSGMKEPIDLVFVNREDSDLISILDVS